MARITDLLTDTRSRYADWLKERLAELPGWDEMSDQERVFLVAYACTGEKAEALRFINRHATWRHERRFRPKAFMDLVTAEPNEHIRSL